ncbi:EKC/KEOPS complex subunit bud32 [Thelohanellus kitauei]|uniref:non-specific serine/threonine protein kinase n=1 Tax=Thelohanellus kitauei TaxID=669202 RepID=A0A0C2N1L5_THEKT|nr:EKC/KEOPS complex subunit bud32 [Thelohanellus kitauei]
MDLEISSVIGKRVSEVHLAGVIHGDLTTTNIVCKISDPREIYIIDFGLSFMSKTPEDRAVDLYVLVRSITSSVPFTDYEAERFNAQIIRTYSNNIGNKIEADKIISRFEQVKLRGRKRLAIG